MSLLLTSVFGPFGVNDGYGRKENKMELFHNQITREQGIFSYRFNHSSFGLYFLAENIDFPTSVLDFPSLKRFIAEVKKGYDYIGISFIIPNFKKAKAMAEIVRNLSPKTKIILGGHGVAVSRIENLIEHDYICKGDGVEFLRNLFGENLNKPIKHPIIYSAFNRSVMGLPLKKDAGVLIPGVGCQNKCRFCATSHFFGKYLSYLNTGKEMFDICCEYEDKLGVHDFGILDENFLKIPERMLELLSLMEKHHKKYSFSFFSSADTLAKINDLDILVRFGTKVIWIGVESQTEIYEKNRGIDLKHLFSELRKRGIAVLASSILFLEHHDKNTIWHDIEFASSLKPDYLQFMQLGPIPGTTLYNDYTEKGKLLKSVPFEEQHGQDKIWFEHEHFTREETRSYTKKAFEFDYEKNGTSLFRSAETAFNGYFYAKKHPDERVRIRAESFNNYLKPIRYLLFAAMVFGRNEATSLCLKNLKKQYEQAFGHANYKIYFLSLFVLLCATKEYFKYRFFGDKRNPRCSLTKSKRQIN